MDQTEKALSSGIKKFDGTEFEVWSFLMEGVLDSKGIWYVMDQIKSELTTDDARQRWDRADRSARTMIMLSLEHDMVKAVMTCTTAKQMWNKLKTIHSQKSESCKMVLWKEYYDCKMEPGIKVSDYVTKIEFVAMKLRNIGEEVTDNNLISKIVSGLSSDYKHFMSNWLATPAVERTYDNLLPRLLAEESINRDSENKSATAMNMSSTGNSRDREKRSKRNIKDMECYHCHKKGHLKRDCRSLKKEEKSGRKPSSHDDKKYAVVANTSVNTKQTWLLDSGASFHMTGQHHWIKDYRQHSEKIPIRVGNNEYVYALGSGSVEALSTIDGQKITVTMKDVQYVPGISDNLFSQGAADDKGIKVVAKRGKIQLISDDTVIITGNKGHGNLYRLNLTVPMQASVARSERSLEEWHKVLGHPDVNEIKNLEKKGCTVGFKIVSRETNDRQRCGECQQGKCHHASHPESRRERAKEVLERVHVDLVGALDPPSLGGSKYFMLLRDEYSSYMHVFFLANKTQVLHAMTKYLTTASIQSQRKVQIIRSDNGSEFKNSGIKLLLEKEGILQEFSAPFTAQQNGEIERANRTVIETARTLLSSSRLPISLWGEAVLTAVYLRNRVTNRRNGDKTPFELFYGKAPDYAHLIEFGRELQLLDNKKGISKFSSKTRDVFMVGYGDRVNTYRCYDPKTNDIVISSDVVIANHVSKRSVMSKPHVGITFTIDRDEQDINPDSRDDTANSHQGEQRDRHLPIDLPEESEESARQRCNLDSLSRNDTFIVERDINDGIDNQQATGVNIGSTHAEPINTSRQTPQSSTIQAEIVPAPNPRSTSLQQSLLTRTNMVYPDLSQVGLSVPSYIPRPSGSNIQFALPKPQVGYQRAKEPTSVQSSAGQSPSKIVERTKSAIDWIMKDRPKRSTKSIYARNLSMISDREPVTYEDAVSGKDSSKWRAAIKDELDAHDRNNTWRIVPKDPKAKEITAKWVFKVKENSGNEPERYKARLVARGFSQQQGVDYKEIFSPVVRTDSIRMLFSVCAQFDLEFKQFDITTAFLYGNIEEDLYIRPPEGLDIPEGSTCKLQKSLYGLKQAPRCWNAKFSKFLELFNMRPTAADPCVYVADTNERMYLALYVDDGLIFAETTQAIDKFIGYLTKHFMVKEVSSNCFIGIEIVRNRSQNAIFLHQQVYISKVLEKFNMAEAKGAATPLEVGHALNKAETLNGEIVDNIPYAEAIGSLLYCAMATRPDIAYTLSVLSKYTSQPRAQHWQGVKRALRYLKQTSDFGIVFQQTEEAKLVCFSDADWAGDHQNRRSTSGLVSFLNSGPISFRAQQQPVVALSTTEAEYIAATLAVKDLIWIQRFIEELKLPISNKGKLLCDNQSALKLMKNPEFHQRSKHIDIRYHFIREKYEEGLFDLEYISSENQKADIFTKALAADRFHSLRKTIGCISLSDFESCDE